MNRHITAPVKGESLKASWATDVTSVVNEMAMMTPSGMLVRDGYMRGLEPLPKNNRGNLLALNPFAVRYVEQNENNDSIVYDGWEIYLPSGCVSIGSSYTPLNPRAYRKDNEIVPDWYRLPCPDDDAQDGDAWSVIVHAKGCAAKDGVDEFQNWPRQYLWAEISKGIDPEMTSEQIQEAADNNINDIGDTFSSTVGTIRWKEIEDSNGQLTHSYAHGVKVPINLRDGVSVDPFVLMFCFDVDEETLELDLKKIYCRNTTFSTGGTNSMTGKSLIEIDKEKEEVYLKISTLTSPYAAELKQYAEMTVGDNTITIDSQVASDQQIGEIYLKLYTLKNGHVRGDFRSALNTIHIYG